MLTPAAPGAGVKLPSNKIPLAWMARSLCGPNTLLSVSTISVGVVFKAGCGVVICARVRSETAARPTGTSASEAK